MAASVDMGEHLTWIKLLGSRGRFDKMLDILCVHLTLNKCMCVNGGGLMMHRQGVLLSHQSKKQCIGRKLWGVELCLHSLESYLGVYQMFALITFDSTYIALFLTRHNINEMTFVTRRLVSLVAFVFSGWRHNRASNAYYGMSQLLRRSVHIDMSLVVCAWSRSVV